MLYLVQSRIEVVNFPIPVTGKVLNENDVLNMTEKRHFDIVPETKRINMFGKQLTRAQYNRFMKTGKVN